MQLKSVIRLRGKTATETKWSQFCETPRSEAENCCIIMNESYGIPCGPVNGLLVVDVDDGALFQEHLSAINANIPDTYTVKTGKGHHLYFQYPNNNGTRYGNLSLKPLGFDVRGAGGYVVGPGSIHVTTGEPYTVLKDSPLAPCPDWVLTHYPANSQPDCPPPTSLSWDKNIDSLPIPDYEKALILGEAGTEDRSADMMRVLNWLSYATLTDDQIFQIFSDFPIGEKSREKKDPEKWLKPQIDRAREYAAIHLGLYTTPEADFGAVATLPVPETWEDPLSLDQVRLPTFTKEDFPPDLWEMVDAASKALEVPPELPGLLGLAVVAIAVQKKRTVQPEGGYEEPLNVFVLPVLDSGHRKSAAISVMAKPLSLWEMEQDQLMEPAIKAARLIRSNQEAHLNALRGRYAKAKDEATRDEIQWEMDALNDDLMPIPALQRLWTQDCSPEKLGSILAENEGRMAIISAEGGVFDLAAGRYNNNIPNLDVYLQAHAGDNIRVDRIGRDSITLEKPALTIAVSPQPEVLTTMAKKPGFRGRGFLGRLLYAIPVSNLGKRTLEPRPVPDDVADRYTRMVMMLLNSPTDLCPITFSPAAYKQWKIFQREIENGMAEGGMYEPMREWAGKAPGTAARIAGIFHCIENVAKGKEPAQISEALMNQAINLTRKLISHALCAYDLMGQDPDAEAAKRVLAWLRLENKTSFTIREVHYRFKKTFRKRVDIDPVLTVLKEYGHIRFGKKIIGAKGGRPTIYYVVNPKTLAKL